MRKCIICFLAGVSLGGVGLPAQEASRKIFPGPNLELRKWDNHPGLSAGRIRSIVQTGDGCIWILTAKELIRFDGYEFKTIPDFRKPGRNIPVFGLRTDSEGRLWLLTIQGAFSIGYRSLSRSWEEQAIVSPASPETATGFPPDPLEAREKIGLAGIDADAYPSVGVVSAAVGDPEGNIWLGAEKGLFRLEEGRRDRSPEPFFKGDAVDVLLLDREGVLWIGTRNSGLSSLRRTSFTTYSLPEDPPTNNIRSVYTDRRGRTWAGTVNGKLLRFQDGRLIKAPLDGGVFDGFMFSMAEDAAGNLLLGTENRGLFHLKDGRLEQVRTREGPVEGTIVSLFTDSRGRIWVCRFGQELGIIENDRYRRFLSTEDGFTHKMIFNIFEDRVGNLWLGHGDGLIFLEGGEADTSRIKSFLNEVPVSSIHEDADGYLWLGTYGRGLVRFDPRSADAFFFSRSNGLESDGIQRLLEDGEGRFWMASSEGILLADRRELNDVAEGRSGRVSCLVFGMDDGLLDSQCSVEHRDSAARLPDGRFAFATQNGLSVADPAALKLNSVPPPVSLEGVFVDGEPREEAASLDQPVVLSTRGRLDIFFRAFSSLGSGGIRYRYRLTGADVQWTVLDPRAERKASFLKIPRGPHVFQVTACNGHGTWNDEGVSIPVVVRPLFYQTAVFLAGTGLLAAAGAAALIRKRRRIRNKRNNKYGRTRLPDELVSDTAARLLDLMERDKLYRDPALSVRSLAGRLSIPSHHLSQVINSKLGKNFFDFINDFRIEEAKARLADDNGGKSKILAIALDVGFGSLGSFNRAFKRSTGKTPSEYRSVANGAETS